MNKASMRSALIGGLLLAASPAAAQMPPQAGAGGGANAALVQICRQDLATYCAGVTPGDGAVKACIKENFRSFSPDCKSALMQAMMQRQQQAQ